MSNHEVTYSNSRVFESSSESQDPIKPEETQGPREVGHKVFQYSREKHELQKTLNNLSQEYSIMQNDRNLMEEMLKNKSRDYDAIKQDLDTLNRTLNRYYRETKFVIESKQHRGKRVEGHWFCCGIKCYYFIMDKKRWSECEQTCQDFSLSLLKIDDDDELKSLQLQIMPNSYWTGLSYNTKRSKWQWIDDGPSKLYLDTEKFDLSAGTCSFLSKARLDNDDCEKLYSCVCEKRLDKFPDSYCSKS